MNPTGFMLRLAYRLRRHRLFGLSLATWLGLLLLVGGLVAAIRAWPAPWPALPWGLVLLAYALFLIWAARQQYICFEAAPLLQDATPGPPLRANQTVPVRASGHFTVEGKDRYFVDIEADLKTTASGEHIVMGRVHPARFLLLGSWPKQELGWWYIFVQPAMIWEVSTGHLQFGRRSRPALRVAYAPGAARDADVLQTIYLTAEDTSTLRQIQDHLLRDTPAAGIEPRAPSGSRD